MAQRLRGQSFTSHVIEAFETPVYWSAAWASCTRMAFGTSTSTSTAILSYRHVQAKEPLVEVGFKA